MFAITSVFGLAPDTFSGVGVRVGDVRYFRSRNNASTVQRYVLEDVEILYDYDLWAEENCC